MRHLLVGMSVCTHKNTLVLCCVVLYCVLPCCLVSSFLPCACVRACVRLPVEVRPVLHTGGVSAVREEAEQQQVKPIPP